MELSSIGAGVRAGAPVLAPVFALQILLVLVADDPLPLRLVIAVAGDSDNPFAGLGAGLALAVFVSLGAGLLAARRASDAAG